MNITTDVKECSACGKDHGELTFVRLDIPFIDPDGTIYEFFANCPTSGVEVLLAVVSSARASTTPLHPDELP